MATTVLAPGATRTYRRSALYEWLTTTDHKKIGILYLTNSFLFFLLAGLLALLIRSNLALQSLQIVDTNTYNQLFTMHGTTMIFLVLMPFLAGLGNYAVPLQIGAADMAFPRINALSFWMLPLGGILMFSGFATGGAAADGWTSYSPLAEAKYSGTGVDLWIVALLLIGASSILSSINFLATIFKLRAPGMTLLRLPVFVWTVAVTNLLIMLATPVFTAGVFMLYIDRNFGGAFFDPASGGNPILWQNLFWFFGHPEVYILILPAMGVISEIVPVFSRKPIFGYRAFIFATLLIGGLGFSVWAHHMFTTGAVYLPFFSLMTGLIGVPTGIKFFNWIATMWRGKISFATPMLFAVGFLTTFLVGGLDGAVLFSPPVDYALHDTYWIVAHIHFVFFGGTMFGVFAAIYYWFPKMFGARLHEGLGKLHFVLMLVGTWLTFFPMHLLGLEGMPRRIADYSPTAGWTDLNVVATIGSFIIAAAMLPFMWNVFVTLRGPRDAGDDPWDAYTLEWATTSPPPPYNFDHLPPIRSERPLFDLKYGHGARRATAAHPALAAGSTEEPRA